MAYPTGFSYVKGPRFNVLSKLSSTATFKARNPVTLSDDRTIIEAGSDSSAIYGISQHDAADSIYAGYCLIEIPTEDTIYAGHVATDASASEVSVGRSCDIVKVLNHFNVDEDSQVTPMVTIVPRDGYSTLDSADSTVWFHFLESHLGVFSSDDSIVIFAQD